MSGSGSELARMLHNLWIRARKDCPCKILAALMDHWDCDGWNVKRITVDDLEFLQRKVSEHPHSAELRDWLAQRCEALEEDTRLTFVLDSLHEEAARRRLPFSRTMARLFVLRAVNHARRGRRVALPVAR